MSIPPVDLASPSSRRECGFRAADGTAINGVMASSALASRALVRRQRFRIFGFLTERGACDIRLFGSVARDEDDDSSGIDLLVEFEPEPYETSGVQNRRRATSPEV